jgi:hypothetical protein
LTPHGDASGAATGARRPFAVLDAREPLRAAERDRLTAGREV